MRNYITAAAGAALLSTAAMAATEEGGNWYGSAVDNIVYSNFAGSGSYNRVTSMDPTTGKCSSTPQGFSGSLGPMSGEVSISMRGPMHLTNFAYYKPGKSSSKRAAHIKRHGHAQFHAEQKRDVGAWVTQTMNGQVVSWQNDYAGAAAPTPVAGAAAAATSVVGGAAEGVTGAAGSVTGGTSGGDHRTPFEPSYNGDWVRHAKYNAASGEAEGVTFLNNNGGQGSGTFDYKFGNSLSYSSADGKTGASSPQVLKDSVIPSNVEVIMMTDKKCSEGSGCGYVRPDTVAMHGFDNKNAVYLFQFSMPHDAGAGGLNPDMSSLWMLNAEIVRTLQYGPSGCSCWLSGCGEFDIMEILDEGNEKAKSTLHSFISGGSSDYFDRPTGAPINVAVVMDDSTAAIKILPDHFKFSKTLSNQDVKDIMSTDDSSGLLQNLPSTVFNLAQMATTGMQAPGAVY